MLEKFNNLTETDIKILKVARNEFLKKGFHKTSIDQIAQKAKVGKGTIYRHFGNKYVLLLSTVTHLLKEKWISASEVLKETDFKTTFSKLIDKILEFHKELNTLFINTFSEEIWKELKKETKKDKKIDELMAFAMQCREETLKLIEQLLKMGQKQNIVPSDINLKIVSEIILITLNHFIITFYMDMKNPKQKNKEYTLEEGITELKNFIYRAICMK